MPYIEGDLRAPEGARFAIIASRWNPRITDALVAAARATFLGNGVDEAAVDVVRVPGAWELPMAARDLAAGRQHAAIVALGCVVRGDTRHYEQVADGCVRRPDARRPGHRRAGAQRRAGGGALRGCRGARRRQPWQQGRGGRAMVAIEMANLREKLA
jgi:6,7-dimethyl-8-ribityllumazine synthase